jgi:hypothetical protein
VTACHPVAGTSALFHSSWTIQAKRKKPAMAKGAMKMKRFLMT